MRDATHRKMRDACVDDHLLQHRSMNRSILLTILRHLLDNYMGQPVNMREPWKVLEMCDVWSPYHTQTKHTHVTTTNLCSLPFVHSSSSSISCFRSQRSAGEQRGGGGGGVPSSQPVNWRWEEQKYLEMQTPHLSSSLTDSSDHPASVWFSRLRSIWRFLLVRHKCLAVELAEVRLCSISLAAVSPCVSLPSPLCSHPHPSSA